MKRRIKIQSRLKVWPKKGRDRGKEGSAGSEGSEGNEGNEGNEENSSTQPTLYSRTLFYTSSVLCLVCGLVATSWLGFYSFQYKQRFEEARIQAKRQAVWANLELGRELLFTQQRTQSLARALSSGRYTAEQVLERLKTQVGENPNILTTGLAYQPLTNQPNVEQPAGDKPEVKQPLADKVEAKLYAPGYARSDDKLQSFQAEKFSNYTLPKNAWYSNAINKGAHWGEPYVWAGSQVSRPVVGFYAPFYNPQVKDNDTPQGVIYAEYALDSLKQVMKPLNLGKTGYGFILSKSGVILYHPNEDYVKNAQNIFDITYQQNNEKLRELVVQALKGEPVSAELTDPATGQNSWLFLRQVPQNGWVVGVVFIQDEILPDTQTTRRQLIGISLAFVWFFVFLSVLLFQSYRGGFKRLVGVTATASLLLAAEIGYVWNLTLKQRITASRNILLSDTSVNQLLASQTESTAELNQEPPILIPTGIFIRSLKFASPTELFVTGYIWQVYSKDIPKDVFRGFFFPGAIDANDLEMKEVYRQKDGDVEVIGWYFEQTFDQNFNYSKYPLDNLNVEIRILPNDFFSSTKSNRKVILTPDLGSYKVINPQGKPGLEEKIIVDGWELQDSFFEYHFKTYQTTFGQRNSVSKTDFPELTYTVVMQRNFISSLIGRIGPVAIVITLLFALLVVADEDKAMELLGACAGFVFIVILDQIALREQVVAQGVIYFEYFYFIVYIYIFLIAMLGILLLTNPNLPFIKYKNNLPSKLLYWPVLLKLLLVISIFVLA